MIVNYVLMYGTPYLKYREFETFEDISKFIVNKSIVNYSIFKKLDDKEEIEMIYRDNDIRYLEKEVDKYKIVLDKIKEILKDPDRDGFDEDGYDDSYYDMIYTNRIKELLEEIK